MLKVDTGYQTRTSLTPVYLDSHLLGEASLMSPNKFLQ